MTERYATVERFTIKQVTSTDQVCQPGQGRSNTFAVTTTYPASLNMVLKTVSEFNKAYKTDRPTAVTGFGPKDFYGRYKAYRWSWERLTPWGGRISDTMWVTGGW